MLGQNQQRSVPPPTKFFKSLFLFTFLWTNVCYKLKKKMWENILRSFLLSWYVSENFVHTVVRFKEPIASMEDMVAHGICGGSWNMW